MAPVQAAFAPSAGQLAWARRVDAAMRAAGGGAINLDGRMVDAPVLRFAQRLLALETQDETVTQRLADLGSGIVPRTR
ncbi:HpcH/HpaI aldolase [Variovorax sp. WDL1]|nr:HpcH/HpaI aldolase [Variovorax sp. WDL1]